MEGRNVARMKGSYLAYEYSAGKFVGKCIYAEVIKSEEFRTTVHGFKLAAGIANEQETEITVVADQETSEVLDKPGKYVAVYGTHNPLTRTGAILAHHTDEPVFRWMPKPAWTSLEESEYIIDTIHETIVGKGELDSSSYLLPVVHVMYVPARQWARSYNRSIITLAGMAYSETTKQFFVIDELEKRFPPQDSIANGIFDNIIFRMAELVTVRQPHTFMDYRHGWYHTAATKDILALRNPEKYGAYNIFYGRIQIGTLEEEGGLTLNIPKLAPVVGPALRKALYLE